MVLTGVRNGLEIAEADEPSGARSPARKRPFPPLGALLLCSPLRLPADVKKAQVVGVDPEQRKTNAKSLSYWKRMTIPRKTVLLPSRIQLASLDEDPFRAVLRLHDLLDVPIVAKLDVDGAFAVDESGAWHVHDEAVQVVETTGAGDAMAGAVLAAIASGCDIATATALGVSVARLALSDGGAGGLINSRPLTLPVARCQNEEKMIIATDARTTLLSLASLVKLAEPNRIEHPVGESTSAVFVGCGDSLAAAILCESYGHRAKSSGDLAFHPWRRSAGSTTLAAISSSGASGATVFAAQKAATHGVSTIAITASARSPLTEACNRTIVVPRLTLKEIIPAANYIMLSLGVLAACNVEINEVPALIGDAIEALVEPASRAVDEFPLGPPSGISVLTLPDMRSAGEFWSMKLIEATGLPVRSVPLEESGHVDYFIGPQPHVTVQLVGREGRDRHAQLSEALKRNGHDIVRLDVGSVTEVRDPESSDDCLAVATGAVGAYVANEVADRWARAPFRNGEVNMDASHIQIGRETD